MATGKEIAVVSKEIGASVMGRITELVSGGQLSLPADYDAGTAVNSAMLILQDTKDRNGRPVLEVCTKASIAKSVLDMVIQGLQPGKKQCYFIAYADQLSLFRSYFGTVAALKRVMPEVAHVTAEVIYEGDEVVYGVTQFGERFVSHINSDPLASIGKAYRGGYCNIYDAKGNVLGSTIMAWGDIVTSWKQSRNYKAEGGIHQKFTVEMAKRTLIAKACKFLLNTSNEMAAGSAAVKSFNDTTDSEFDMEVQNEQKPQNKRLSFKERHGIAAPKAAEAPEPEQQPEETDIPSSESCPEQAESEDEPFGDVPPEQEQEPDMFAGMEDVSF